MNTKFPYEGTINLEAYLDAYWQRKDAIRALPTEEELKEIARKGLVKNQLVLAEVPAGEAAQRGDTVALKTVSELPKFHKERVTVSIGRGLYDRTLEAAIEGLKAGESCEVLIKEKPVTATVLEIRRKSAPEPTDEMAAALQQKDMRGNLIQTVAEYEAYVKEQKINETLATINYYVMEAIMKDYPVTEYEEEDIRILGELEEKAFIQIFQEQEGIDLRRQVPQSWEEDMGIHSLEEFITKRHDWYQIKIHQCLLYLNILNLPCEGKTDPLDHYEVLSELTEQMFNKIETILRRNH